MYRTAILRFVHAFTISRIHLWTSQSRASCYDQPDYLLLRATWAQHQNDSGILCCGFQQWWRLLFVHMGFSSMGAVFVHPRYQAPLPALRRLLQWRTLLNNEKNSMLGRALISIHEWASH